MSITEADLRAVDSFLADAEKHLDGVQPEWRISARNDYEIQWPIIEGSGLLRSSLRFRVPIDDLDYPTVSVVFRNEMITRFDKVRPTVCEPNPLAAHKLGLPARVCGPHFHKWSDNRAYVESTGEWKLPLRRPIPDPITRLQQMFLWFADEIQLTLTHEQRMIDTPPRGLFSVDD